jgi:acyl-CoA synthetase (AMP-forming)/AMP-acid ligase II
LLFTSGSTGMPKAVINTQKMMCANAKMMMQVRPRRMTPRTEFISTGCLGTTPWAAMRCSMWH